jgi:segregation and condensation protein B
VSTDERPDSLAAQAASWVPPWERPQPPDRAYQAASMAAAAEVADDPEPVDDPEPAAVPERAGEPESADEADGVPEPAAELEPAAEPEASAEPEPADEADGVPAELSPLPGEVEEAPAVDAPVEVPDEEPAGPTDVGAVPEVPLPTPIEDAGEQSLDEERGPSVDAPVPDGDDAGDVFDAAADDDPGEDGDMDMPPVEEDIDSFRALAAFAAGAGDAEAALANVPDGHLRSTVPTQGRGSQGLPAAVGEEDARSGNESDLPALDDRELRAALEAILLVVDEPVGEMQLAQIVEQPTERVAAMLEDISARYTAAGHGFDLRRAAGGWRLYTRPEYAPYVERFVLDGQSVRLTQAALETLAVIAYKQPVTRSRISAIRGVNCDGVMRTLGTRGLIEECGTEGETGAYLYRTTPLFLEKLGLNSVDDLPPLAPFLPDDVEEVLDASG